MGTTFDVSEWVKQETLDENNGRYKWQLRWSGENFYEGLEIFKGLFNNGAVVQMIGRNVDHDQEIGDFRG